MTKNVYQLVTQVTKKRNQRYSNRSGIYDLLLADNFSKTSV